MAELQSRLHWKKELFLVSLVFFVFCSVHLIGLMDITIPLYIYMFDVFAGDEVALLHASKLLSMFKTKNTATNWCIVVHQTVQFHYLWFEPDLSPKSTKQQGDYNQSEVFTNGFLSSLIGNLFPSELRL